MQVLVVPIRVNVNLKSLTVEDLTNRRKVRTSRRSCARDFLLSLICYDRWN